MDHPLLAGFPVTVRIPIQWGDMDAYGHVNNTVYFRLFETARIAYLERCGFIESYERERIGAILRSTECHFRLPLGYPDDVLVGARTIDVQVTRLRRKIEVDPKYPRYLQTVRGTGYVLMPD